MNKHATIGELHKTIGGQLLPADVVDAPLGPVVTDSRTVVPGDLFWAINGPNHDATKFAAEAFIRGAAGAVVDGPVNIPKGQCLPKQWTIEVENKLPLSVGNGLKKLGIMPRPLGEYHWPMGSMQVVWSENGLYKGTADPRRLGVALGY